MSGSGYNLSYSPQVRSNANNHSNLDKLNRLSDKLNVINVSLGLPSLTSNKIKFLNLNFCMKKYQKSKRE